MEAAIVALLKSTGADDELFERQVREGHDAAGAGIGKTTREDLDDANLRYSDRGVVFLQAAITRLLTASYRHCREPEPEKPLRDRF